MDEGGKIIIIQPKERERERDSLQLCVGACGEAEEETKKEI